MGRRGDWSVHFASRPARDVTMEQAAAVTMDFMRSSAATVLQTLRPTDKPGIRRVTTYDLDAIECGTYDEARSRHDAGEITFEALVEKAVAASALACDAALAFSEDQKKWLMGEPTLPVSQGAS